MKWKSILLLTTLSFHSFAGLKDLNELKSPFTLAPLPYDAKSLDPAIDEETMKLHHDKHHQAYVDKANTALGEKKVTLLSLLGKASKQEKAVRNNAGGHWNHTFFWDVLSGDKANNEVPAELKAEIEKTFGGWDKFTAAFEKAGADQFGSGWAWLIVNKTGKLEITSTPNQDNPIMNDVKTRGWPVLGADVWEHAYYLKYRNQRADYLKNFWSIVNWKKVNELRNEAKGLRLP